MNSAFAILKNGPNKNVTKTSTNEIRAGSLCPVKKNRGVYNASAGTNTHNQRKRQGSNVPIGSKNIRTPFITRVPVFSLNDPPSAGKIDGYHRYKAKLS